MISISSLKNYVFINGLIFSIGFFEHHTIHYLKNDYIEFFLILAVFFLRNVLFIEIINYNLKNKESIHPSFTKKEDYIEDYKHEFILNVLSSTTVETLTYMFIKNTLFQPQNHIFISINDLVYFIPKSFLFELIFDFFHYWTHRILHSNKFLYVHIHKKHHKFNYPMPILTFYHHPLDLIITNSIPQILTLCIFPSNSLFQFNLILSYKSFIEINGHSSKKIYPCGSFSQFIWLPRWLNISLYSEDHTHHHSSNFCNYSKRFSLWDKQFNTYSNSILQKCQKEPQKEP